MLTRPPDLSDAAVADALATGWDLRTNEIEYAPVGFGSHHWRAIAGNRRWFVTVDDLDARQRVATDTRDDAAARLSAALGTARSLRDSGLNFVIAPLLTGAGDVVHRINDRYVLALYEHIEGATLDWGTYASRSDRLAILDVLISLHAAPTTALDCALVDDFVIPGREQLQTALDRRDCVWGPGPLAHKAKELLQQNFNALAIAFARYDDLVRTVTETPERFVITHGEPHRGNTINTTEGVVLIDWDTGLLAPPERDLWMLLDEDPSIAVDYTIRTRVGVDPSAVQLYRLWWDLCEVSLYTAEFRAAHNDTEDIRKAWGELRHYLDPQRWWRQD